MKTRNSQLTEGKIKVADTILTSDMKWDATTKTFLATGLGKVKFGHILSTAATTGLFVQSAKTGKVATFFALPMAATFFALPMANEKGIRFTLKATPETGWANKGLLDATLVIGA